MTDLKIVKRLALPSILALLAVAFSASGFAQASKIPPGTYKGTFTGGQGGGDFHLTLKPAPGGGLTAEVGFSLNGEEVPGKIVSLKSEGAKIEVVYDFDLQGAKLQSAAEGTLDGKTLKGTYKTTADGAGVDEGTWSTTLQ